MRRQRSCAEFEAKCEKGAVAFGAAAGHVFDRPGILLSSVPKGMRRHSDRSRVCWFRHMQTCTKATYGR